MRTSIRGIAATGLVVLAASVRLAGAADAVDPALAKSWEFVQKAMPGLPYDVLKAACAEGNLTIYEGTWADAQQSQIDHFKERFPCMSVRTFEFDTGTRRSRFLTEFRANHDITDIVQDSDPGSLDTQAEQGLLMKYKITNDASYADSVKDAPYWYPLRIGISGNAWNTDLVSPEQAGRLFGWEGIADPIWQGKAGVSDPSGGGSSFLPYYVFDKLYGEPFFQKLGAIKPRAFISNEAADAALASGDVAVVLGVSETALTTMWLQGAPIRWSLPEPGIGPVTGQAINAHAPHPNAARLYQEYAFSSEGYAYWQKLGGPPARIGYKDQRKVAAESWYKYPTKFFQYDPADVTKDKDKILGLYKKWIVGNAK